MRRICGSQLHAGCAFAFLGLGLLALLGACEEGSPNRPPSGNDPVAGAGGSGASTGTAGTANAGNAGTSSSGAGGMMEQPPPDDEEPADTVFGFADDIDGWFIAYTDPPYLMQQMAEVGAGADAGAADAGQTSNGDDTEPLPNDAGAVELASIAHDPVAGSHQPGSMVIHCPFQGFMRDDLDNEFGAIKVGLQYNFPEPVDLTNATILASARLNAGVYDNAMTPAGVKLSIRSGENDLYADGGFTNLEDANRNMWFRFAYATNNPAYEDPGEHDLSNVTALGIEISTNSTGAVSPGSVHIDTIEIRGGATAVPRQD